MLNIQQIAGFQGLAGHDIPVLIDVGLLKPLGDPPPNAVNYFASIQVPGLALRTLRRDNFQDFSSRAKLPKMTACTCSVPCCLNFHAHQRNPLPLACASSRDAPAASLC